VPDEHWAAFSYRTLIAYEIGRAPSRVGAEWNEDPWPFFEAVLDRPCLLPDGVAAGIGDTHRRRAARR
jgi:hypothetical protein